VAAKPTFTRMLARFFNEDVADWSGAMMSTGSGLRQYATKFSDSERGRTGSTTGFCTDDAVSGGIRQT